VRAAGTLRGAKPGPTTDLATGTTTTDPPTVPAGGSTTTTDPAGGSTTTTTGPAAGSAQTTGPAAGSAAASTTAPGSPAVQLERAVGPAHAGRQRLRVGILVPGPVDSVVISRRPIPDRCAAAPTEGTRGWSRHPGARARNRPGAPASLTAAAPSTAQLAPITTIGRSIRLDSAGGGGGAAGGV